MVYRNARTSGGVVFNRLATISAAEQAVKAIGSNAIPTLVRWLQTRDSKLKTKMNVLLDKQGFIRYRFPTAESRQDMAVDGLKLLGTNALSAAPEIVRFIQSVETGASYVHSYHDGSTYNAFYMLTPTNRSAVRGGFSASSYGNPQFRALEYLLALDRDRRILLPELFPMLSCSNPAVQTRVANHLQEYYPLESENAGINQRFPTIPPPPAIEGWTNSVAVP